MKLKILLDDCVITDRELDLINPKHFREISSFIGPFVVQSKLVKLGITSQIIGSSRPCDLLLLNSYIPIEVKVARKGYTQSGYDNKIRRYECYAFDAQDCKAPVIVVWALDINKFYICSIDELNPGVNKIFPNASRWQQREDNWEFIKNLLSNFRPLLFDKSVRQRKVYILTPANLTKKVSELEGRVLSTNEILKEFDYGPRTPIQCTRVYKRGFVKHVGYGAWQVHLSNEI